MSNDKREVENLDGLFRQAVRQQKQVNQALEKALEEISPHDSQVLLEAHQLTLQLRLDTQDVITQLLRMNQSLCQAIGIEPQSSKMANLERAAFALGKDNLKHALSFLIELTNKLRKALEISRQALLEQEKEHKKLLKLLKKLKGYRDKFSLSLHDDGQDDDKELSEGVAKARRARLGKTAGLRTALDYQANFHLSITQLTEAFQEFGSIPKFGVIYDYLAGLKGPISRFFQAAQNGIITLELLMDRVRQGLGHKEPKLALEQYQQQMTRQLTDITVLQTRLMQQTHNRLHYVNQLSAQLDKQLTQKSSLEHSQDKISQESVARRMMDLFNR